MTIAEIRAKHPMPWKYVLIGGTVLLQDAAGAELPMFLMLDFMTHITGQLAKAE